MKVGERLGESPLRHNLKHKLHTNGLVSASPTHFPRRFLILFHRRRKESAKESAGSTPSSVSGTQTAQTGATEHHKFPTALGTVDLPIEDEGEKLHKEKAPPEAVIHPKHDHDPRAVAGV